MDDAKPRKSERRKRTALVSVRLTPAESEAVQEAAGGRPVSRFLRELVLAGARPGTGRGDGVRTYGGYRYYLSENDGPEREVTKAEFVAAERAAGFYSANGPAECATAGFSGEHRTPVTGRVEWQGSSEEERER